MPPKRRPPHDPLEWLNRARSNLALAKGRVPDAYLEDLCFEAQQAAEKALNALLIKLRVQFPHVHDLARLFTLLERAGEAIPEAVRRAEMLSPYAIVARYPGLAEPVTEAQYQEAIALAQAVIEWVEPRLR